MGFNSFIQNSLKEQEEQIKGSQPEWCISTIYHAWDTPFWLETLEMLKNPYLSYLQDFFTVIFLTYSTLMNIWVASCNFTKEWLHKF